MSNISFVKDQNGTCGIWLKDPNDLNKTGFLEVIIMKECGQFFPDYLAKRYRKVDNTFDSSGGCFVMFGSSKAPGE